MRPRFVLPVFVALHVAVACVVPTFDVDAPGASGATGGSSTSGGKDQIGKAGTNAATAGVSASGGKSSVSTGGAGEGAESALGGASTGAGGASAAGPVRVGFSVFHDSAAGADEASSNLADATFSKPEGTAPGDLMLVFIGCDHQLTNLDASTLAPSGWKVQDQHEGYGTDGQGTYLLYKFAGAAEPDSIVFAEINPAGGGNGVQGLLSVYRGVNQSAPFNAHQPLLVKAGTDNTTHIVTATPAITTTVDDCLLIAGLSPDTAVDAPVVTSWPAGFDENQVSVINPPTPYPNGWANIYSAERHLAKASTVPASAFEWELTYGGSEYYGSLAFVLALAPQ
jgi:hypothetical protein